MLIFLGGIALFALIPPYYLDCVVAIGQRVPVIENGQLVIEKGQPKQKWEPLASGFLYGDFTGEISEGKKRYRVFLVSNRHVFDGRQNLVLRFNPKESKPAKEYELPLSLNGKQLWAAPTDPTLDVAVQLINMNKLRDDGIQAEFFESDSMAVDMARAGELGVTEGDGAFVLGFPLQLVGGERNFVIVRQASIARIRDTIAKVSKDFLLDTFIFPGNSGGPVVLRPEITSIQGTKSQNQSLLIGLVSFFRTYQEVAVSKQTGRPRVMFEENAGLASVVTVDGIREAIAEAAKINPPSTPKE
jgi:hypothetical protein